MAEIVNLFEVNIDTDKAIKDAAEAKKSIDGLKRSIKDLEAAEGDNTKEIAQATAALKNEQDALRTSTKLTQQAIKSQNAQTGSIEEMRAQLAIVSIQWAKLSKEERNNSERGKELTRQKTQLTEALKKEEQATGDARRNVGNYSRGIQDAIGSMTSFVPAAGTATNAIKQLGFAFKVGLGPISLLIGTIGLVVAAFKSFFTSSEEGQNALKRLSAIFDVVVGNIVDLLSKLGKALLEPKQALEDLRSFFENTLGKVILGIVENAFARIGKGIAILALAWENLKDTFTDNADGINDAQERIERANVAIEESNKKITDGVNNTVEAYNDAKQAVIEFTKEQEMEIAISQKLADQQAKLDKQIRKSSIDNANDQAKIAELRAQAADKENTTSQERIDFLEEAERLEKETLKRNEDILAQKLQIRQTQNALSNSTKEDLEEEARLEVELINLRTQNSNARRRLLSELSTARKEVRAEAEAEELAALDAELAREQERLDKQIQTAIRSGEIEQERIDMINEARALDFENKLALEEEQFFQNFENERQRLEMQRQQEIAFAEKIGADTTLINKKYSKAQLEITKAELSVKASLAADFASNIATLAGEGTAIGKAAAVASTTISTIQGAVAALTGMISTIPGPVGIALGAVAAAATAASGFANVKKILSVKSGLPGESTISGGGNNSIASTPSVPSTRSSVADDVTSGIISRDTTSIRDNQNIELQPTLVVDNVTNEQVRSNNNNNTATI